MNRKGHKGQVEADTGDDRWHRARRQVGKTAAQGQGPAQPPHRSAAVRGGIGHDVPDTRPEPPKRRTDEGSGA